MELKTKLHLQNGEYHGSFDRAIVIRSVLASLEVVNSPNIGKVKIMTEARTEAGEAS
jgi:hypothetical protein